jgi:hypothetical protein
MNPVTGQQFKMGRKRPLVRGPRLSLKNYLTKSLPTPPASGDYMSKASASLGMVLGNDALGDCTAAGAMHIEGIFRANSGSDLPPPTQEQTIQFYSATTGYNPADPSTDQGGDEQVVLSYWQNKGLFADGSGKCTGWVAVNGQDFEEVITALYLFENLYFGIELPDAWVTPFPSSNDFTWDVAGDADPENGHCFISGAWQPNKVRTCTWGMQGWLTEAAIAKYTTAASGGELYTILSPDSINKATQKAPNGFLATSLLDDLNSIKG